MRKSVPEDRSMGGDRPAVGDGFGQDHPHAHRDRLPAVLASYVEGQPAVPVHLGEKGARIDQLGFQLDDEEGAARRVPRQNVNGAAFSEDGEGGLGDELPAADASEELSHCLLHGGVGRVDESIAGAAAVPGGYVEPDLEDLGDAPQVAQAELVQPAALGPGHEVSRHAGLLSHVGLSESVSKAHRSKDAPEAQVVHGRIMPGGCYGGLMAPLSRAYCGRGGLRPARGSVRLGWFAAALGFGPAGAGEGLARCSVRRGPGGGDVCLGSRAVWGRRGLGPARSRVGWGRSGASVQAGVASSEAAAVRRQRGSSRARGPVVRPSGRGGRGGRRGPVVGQRLAVGRRGALAVRPEERAVRPVPRRRPGLAAGRGAAAVWPVPRRCGRGWQPGAVPRRCGRGHRCGHPSQLDDVGADAGADARVDAGRVTAPMPGGDGGRDDEADADPDAGPRCRPRCRPRRR
jgi:hypothetical protein